MSFPLPKAFQLVDDAYAKARLSHAYLITGPNGSGKGDLAARFLTLAGATESSLGKSGLEAFQSPTTAIVSPRSKSRRIRVSEIRELEHVLQMAAPAGTTKFAIIQDADRMNEEAANAFLKTLEEPPNGSRILLITARPELLLDTILSRCVRIDLIGETQITQPSASEAAVLDALTLHAQRGQAGLGSALTVMSAFSAALKQEKAAIAEHFTAMQKEEVKQLKNVSEGDYLKNREDYYKAVTEAEYLQKRSEMVELLVMWWGDAMRAKAGYQRLDLPGYQEGTAALSQRFSLDELYEKLKTVEELRANLQTNILEALAIEVCFMKAFS